MDVSTVVPSAATATTNSSSTTRPVSIHGNLIHNQSIYANVASPKNNSSNMMNGGLNISTSAPTSSYRLNTASSMNANLNLSNLNSSSNASPGGGGSGSNQTKTTLMDTSSREHSHHELNTTQISPIGGSNSNSSNNHNHRQRSTSATSQQQLYNNVTVLGVERPNHHSSTFHHNVSNGGLNITNGLGKKLNTSLVPANVSRFMSLSKEAGVKEMITSLALLCLVSLLLALLSLVFLLKISPVTRENASQLQSYDFLSHEEYVVVYEVTLAMCALTLSLNLCCLLVCAIQFLFAVKLVKSTQGRAR